MLIWKDMIFFIDRYGFQEFDSLEFSLHYQKQKFVSCSPESCKICVISINCSQFSLQNMHLEKNSETKINNGHEALDTQVI